MGTLTTPQRRDDSKDETALVERTGRCAQGQDNERSGTYQPMESEAAPSLEPRLTCEASEQGAQSDVDQEISIIPPKLGQDAEDQRERGPVAAMMASVR
jgi:hypothetical protein